MVKWFSRFFKKDDPRKAFIAHQESLSEPWAMFEVTGFEQNGQIRVEFSWNEMFIKKLNEIGFQAETPEDTVQLFFYASQMRPTGMDGGDETIQSADLPTLSANSNRIV